MGFETLRRWPDLETPELRAWDAADALLLDEAATSLAESSPGSVAVIGDDFGALTLGALERGAADVRVHQDPLTGERALDANARTAGATGFRHLPLTAELVRGASLVLLRLPRSLAALDEIAALIAAQADPTVVVVAGGRIKHMTLGMNEVLARRFARVDVSLARQKSRLLIARTPLPTAADAVPPRRRFHAELGLWAVATGGVFADASIDVGTRALLESLDQVPPFERGIDLGCGTGLLAAALARSQPGARVLASDRSAAAVASAGLTMEANGIDTVRVTRDDALSAETDASADLILLNPPFHTGAVVHSGLADKLFAASARVLRPGGELWTVWNSHLGYRAALERTVGPTTQVTRTPKFTVTRSRRR